MGTTISGLRKEHLNNEIEVKGYVLKVGDVRPRVENIKYECKNCGAILIIQQTGEILVFPDTCHCKSKMGFKELAKEFSDMQQIVITEPENNSRKLTSLLKNELCDKAKVGKSCTFKGKLKESPILTGKKTSVNFDFSFEVSDIIDLPQDPDTDIHNTTKVASTRRNRVLVFKQTLLAIQKKTGKLIHLELIEKELQGRFNQIEFEECVSILEKSGEIFMPKKGYVQII